MNYNIEYEESFLNLFGYKAIGPDNSNRWIIVDENNNAIGFIQKKKIRNKNIKKGLPAVYGYHTIINSSAIYYENTRPETAQNSSYEFDIKRNDGNTNHVLIEMGSNVLLRIWSQEYGFIDFRIDYETLFFNFKSKTENFNLEETTFVKLGNYDEFKSYGYILSFCRINDNINFQNNQTTLTIEFDYKPYHYLNTNKQMKIAERKWQNGKLVNEKTSIVEGTIEDAITKHEMGINSFKHLRYLLNRILPFREEIITSLIEKRGLSEKEFALFMPDLDEQMNGISKK